MKLMCVVTCLLACAAGPAVAQRAVMFEELTASEIRDAVKRGKTTLVVVAGGVHENAYWLDDVIMNKTPEANGPGKDTTAVSKHNIIAPYLARRISEELGNAIGLVIAQTPNPGDPLVNKGHMLLPGTISLSNETFTALAKDMVNSAITSSGFKNVIMLVDNGGPDTPMRLAAEALNNEWASKGVRVHYSPMYKEAKDAATRYFATLGLPSFCLPMKTWAELTGTTRACHIAIDDPAEVMFIMRDRVRPDQFAPALAKFITPENGKVLLEQKVKIAVQHARAAIK